MGHHYSKLCRLIGVKNMDARYSVAVMDSVLSTTEKFEERYNVVREMDLIGEPDIDDTTGHGKGVFSILYSTATNMDLYIYRVVRESGVILQRDLLKSMYAATYEDQVDVINLSLGFDHSTDGVSCDMPNEPCKVRESASRAIDEGISVVAAAGNADPTDDPEKHDMAVCCPALLDDTICVGGFVPFCTYKPPEEDRPGLIRKDEKTLPPLAAWMVPKDLEYSGLPLCTGLDCTPLGTQCEDNRVIQSWEGNVSDENRELDILAPVAYPIIDVDNEPNITRGTSYAAPYVTSAVGTILALLRENEKEATPQQLCSFVIDSGTPVDKGEGNYLCIEKAVKIADAKIGLSGGFSAPDIHFDLIDKG